MPQLSFIYPSVCPSDHPSQVCSLIAGQSVHLFLPCFNPQHFVWGKAVPVLTLPSKKRTTLVIRLRIESIAVSRGPITQEGALLSGLPARCKGGVVLGSGGTHTSKE